MECVVCNKEIHPGRLKALPNTKTCVECSNIEKVAGFRIISGKNTYHEIQLVSQEMYKKLNHQQYRKGQSPGNGVRFKGH
jgi:acetate kinase